MRITRTISGIPVAAACSECYREFKLPMTMMGKTSGARANLQELFDRHKCKGEDLSQAAAPDEKNKITEQS
jgi:hypothetical protein